MQNAMSSFTFLFINVAGSLVTGFIGTFLAQRILGQGVGHYKKISGILTVWIILIAVSVSFVLYLVETRWALSLTSCFMVVIIYLVVAITITLLVSLVEHKKKDKVNVAFCGGVLFLILIVYFVDRGLPHYISVNCPSFVSDTAIIHGRTAHWGQWNVVVLVHPMKTEEWWVQQIPVPDQKGNWQAELNFGGVSQDIFEILAIASHDKIPLRTGQTISPIKIPEHMHRSKIYEVEKK